MKMTKRCIAAFLAVVMVSMLALSGCGAEEVKLVESDITAAQVQEEFWNNNLDASAEFLNGFRAQSPEEVGRLWQHAKIHGNGAILYALYSSDVKETYLYAMKRDFAIWNFYFGKEDQKPQSVTISQPLPVEGIDNMYYCTISNIESDGNTKTTYDIYIELVDGGYFVTSETSPEIEQN